MRVPGVTSIDSHLSEFYRLGHRSGPDETVLPLATGLAIKIETSWWARRSVHDQFPWYLPGFSGTMFIAVGIPPADRRTELKGDERVVTLNAEEALP